MKPSDSAITLRKAAAEQIKQSADKDSNVHGWPLRLAVRQDDKKTFHYAMGFDDKSHEDDISFKSEGVEVVVSAGMISLLKGITIDYAEIEAGQPHFIFLNPNDPSYIPPKE